MILLAALIATTVPCCDGLAHTCRDVADDAACVEFLHEAARTHRAERRPTPSLVKPSLRLAVDACEPPYAAFSKAHRASVIARRCVLRTLDGATAGDTPVITLWPIDIDPPEVGMEFEVEFFSGGDSVEVVAHAEQTPSLEGDMCVDR